MNVDLIFSQIRPICKLVGAVMILIAAAKLFGFGPSVMGSSTEYALVGLGLVHV